MSLSNYTVGDLRQLLEQYPDDTLVVLSGDSEGNYFSPAVDHTQGHYIDDGGDRGDFISDEEAAEDEDINLDDAVNAIVLWPSN